MSTTPSRESATFHLTLGHLGKTSYYLAAGPRRFPLVAHTAETLAEAAKSNRALALLPDERRNAFTHYVENVDLHDDRAQILRVQYPCESGVAGDLDGVALMHVHTSAGSRRAWAQAKGSALGAPALLALAGVDATGEDLVQLAVDAGALITTMSSAASVVFQHPQLATSNQTLTNVVVNDHILQPQNLNNVELLSAVITKQPNGSWISSVPSTDSQGNTLTYGPSFSKAGQPVYCQSYSATTLDAAGGALAIPLNTSQDDSQLQNSSWSSSLGISSTANAQSASQTTGALRRRLGVTAGAVDLGDFTVDNKTPGHGLEIDSSSLQWQDNGDGSGTLSINVKNIYLRSLWAYAQYADTNGPIDGGTWNSLALVSPVNVVLGVPMPTDPTTLSLSWPAGASSATLAHGGLGTSNWNNDIVWPGVVLTGVFNYGIPMLFLYIGSLLDNNAWLKEIEEDEPTQAVLIKLGVSILGSLHSNAIGFPNIKTILTAFADGIAGFIAHAGLEKLQAYCAEKLGEAALEDAIPFVDLIFQIADRAVDLAELGETTVEVLTSPAVYTVDILRTMPLIVTVSPDPTHGIWPDDSDHWEVVIQYGGATFVTDSASMVGVTSSDPITTTFSSLPEGGQLQAKFNVYAADDTLLGAWSSAVVPAVRPGADQTLTLSGAIQEALVPLTASTVYQYKQKLVYDTVQQMHVWQANEFSLDSQNLQSDITALDAAQIASDITQAFQQNGFELSSAAAVTVSTPGQEWKITDGSSTFSLILQSGGSVPYILVFSNNAPQATLPYNPSDTGNNLGLNVDITINDRASMLGYCWEASGQNIPLVGTSQPITSQIFAFQNINALASPESSLKFSGAGFTNAPFIVYDQFGPAPLFSVSTTADPDVESDLDQGIVSSDLQQLFADFLLPLPQNAIANVVQADVQWTIGASGQTPVYQLNRLTDMIQVFPYPTQVISQNNFYLEPTSTDPTNYQYQLRQITLDDTTPFDMQQTVSWGTFLLPGLTDVVVHPQGYVIGAHFTQSRLEVLQLPSAAVPDAQAIPAVQICGPGQREGLISGPAALTVTADGRIIVLEQGNQRMQSIDVNGNPVPCFAASTLSTSIPSSESSALDGGLVSLDLRQQFASAGAPLTATWNVQDGGTIYQLADNGQGAVVVTSGGANLSSQWTITDSTSPTPQTFQLAWTANGITVSNGTTQLFTLPASSMQTLDAGSVSNGISDAFTANDVTLVNPVTVTGNVMSLDTTVESDLAAGTIPGDLTTALSAIGITLGSSAFVAALVVVIQQTPGAAWQLEDVPAGNRYQLTLAQGASTVGAVLLSATQALQAPPDNAAATLLDIAAETMGYLYTLAYTGDGTAIGDYYLDIYEPSGAFVSRTLGVNAAAMVIDMWRNLYSLNYETFLGPVVGSGPRTEPSVSVWTPSV